MARWICAAAILWTATATSLAAAEPVGPAGSVTTGNGQNLLVQPSPVGPSDGAFKLAPQHFQSQRHKLHPHYGPGTPRTTVPELDPAAARAALLLLLGGTLLVMDQSRRTAV